MTKGILLKALSGFVHTTDVKTEWKEGANLERKPMSKCVTRWYGAANKPEQIASFRFNPNKEEVYAPESSRFVKLGNCISYADFVKVSKWTEGMIGGEMVFMRVDFAIDYRDADTQAAFRKLCDMLIIALVVKDGISRKNQQWTTTLVSREKKSAKATGEHIEIERYRKDIQKPGSDVIWRLELRYIGNNAHKKHEQVNSVENMLEAIKAELQGLKTCKRKVEDAMNEALFEEYKSLEERKGDGRINKTQFVLQNDDRIFSGQQLNRLARTMGAGKNYSKYYGRNNDHLYITNNEYIMFIDSVIDCIEKWVNNTPTFTTCENRRVVQ